MEQQPLVSIISGYYNREDFVDDSIQSLIDQTYKNTEIIIFDDCSTDQTYDRLVAIADTDSRIRLVKNTKNKGFVKSLIDAVESAKGEYIAIHGSGDFSYPTRIEKQVDVLNSRREIGVVGTFVENITVDGKSENIELFENAIDGNATEILKVTNIFTHGEVMFRKDLHDEVRGYREFFKFAQDYDLWSRLSVKCDFYNIPEVLYKRYLRTDGATVNPEKRLHQALLTELIHQNFSYIITEQSDLVDRFGSEAFRNLGKLSRTGAINLNDRLLKVFFMDKKISGFSKQAAVIFLRKSDKKILGILFVVLFNLPRFINSKMLKIPKFKTLIEVANYKWK